jgi:hypothetical protein
LKIRGGNVDPLFTSFKGFREFSRCDVDGDDEPVKWSEDDGNSLQIAFIINKKD